MPVRLHSRMLYLLIFSAVLLKLIDVVSTYYALTNDSLKDSLKEGNPLSLGRMKKWGLKKELVFNFFFVVGIILTFVLYTKPESRVSLMVVGNLVLLFPVVNNLYLCYSEGKKGKAWKLNILKKN